MRIRSTWSGVTEEEKAKAKREAERKRAASQPLQSGLFQALGGLGTSTTRPGGSGALELIGDPYKSMSRPEAALLYEMASHPEWISQYDRQKQEQQLAFEAAQRFPQHRAMQRLWYQQQLTKLDREAATAAAPVPQTTYAQQPGFTTTPAGVPPATGPAFPAAPTVPAAPVATAPAGAANIPAYLQPVMEFLSPYQQSVVGAGVGASEEARGLNLQTLLAALASYGQAGKPADVSTLEPLARFGAAGVTQADRATSAMHHPGTGAYQAGLRTNQQQMAGTLSNALMGQIQSAEDWSRQGSMRAGDLLGTQQFTPTDLGFLFGTTPQSEEQKLNQLISLLLLRS